jgi:transcription antitermination factor NusG
MEVTKEEIAQVLSVLLRQIINDWTKEKIHSDVLEVIMKMRIETKSEDEYIQLLLANVAFATESTYALQQILEAMLTNKSFPSAAAVEAMMTEAQTRIHEQLPNIIGQYEARFSPINDETERKQQLERSYCAILVANRIKTDFILSFIHESNQQMMKGFFDANPNDVLEAFHHLSGAYASIVLEGLELEY